MEFTFERKINYYETDKMGVVHHSNYIRFFEEARWQFLQNADLPYDKLESNGIMSPVLGFSCKYKQHVTFGDIIEIHTHIKEFTGVKFTVSYKDGKALKFIVTESKESQQGSAFLAGLEGDKDGSILNNLADNKAGSTVTYNAVSSAMETCLNDYLSEYKSL